MSSEYYGSSMIRLVECLRSAPSWSGGLHTLGDMIFLFAELELRPSKIYTPPWVMHHRHPLSGAVSAFNGGVFLGGGSSVPWRWRGACPHQGVLVLDAAYGRSRYPRQGLRLPEVLRLDGSQVRGNAYFCGWICGESGTVLTAVDTCKIVRLKHRRPML